MTTSVPAIRLTGLRKSFGAVEAVAGIDLEIADGEFFSMLGPSGSGKTTVLRMIAGFELPTGGTVALSGRDVTRLPPFERDVNTVFQDYALFPHMTVLENVEYGLKVRKVGRKERRARALEALSSVRLQGFESRKPSETSGGQRQRVALARALVNRPKVLLLDEPLGALDLKLREQMQVELKQIQRDVGITFVFVTHDQDEALTMSDRVAVFDAGRIAQVGTPEEVYEQPATPFVAGFVGTSNLLSGEAAVALVEFVVAQTVDVDAQIVGDLVIRYAFEHRADWRALLQVAGTQRDRSVGCGSFPLEHCGQVRGTSYAVRIREQAIVKIIDVQDSEFVDGALPAAGEQEKGRS